MKPTVITIISSPHVSGDSVLQKLVIITVHCGTVDDIEEKGNEFYIYKRINCTNRFLNALLVLSKLLNQFRCRSYIWDLRLFIPYGQMIIVFINCEYYYTSYCSVYYFILITLMTVILIRIDKNLVIDTNSLSYVI